jgi:uncharacterized protein (TIGR02246 family)
MLRALGLNQILSISIAVAVFPSGLIGQGSPTRTSRDANVAADKEPIQAIMKEASAALRAGDAERWVAIFSDDGIMMPANRPAVTGRKALLQLARERVDKFTMNAEIKPLEIEVCGDWAFARTTVSGTVTPRTGARRLSWT